MAEREVTKVVSLVKSGRKGSYKTCFCCKEWQKGKLQKLFPLSRVAEKEVTKVVSLVKSSKKFTKCVHSIFHIPK